MKKTPPKLPQIKNWKKYETKNKKKPYVFFFISKRSRNFFVIFFAYIPSTFTCQIRRFYIFGFRFLDSASKAFFFVLLANTDASLNIIGTLIPHDKTTATTTTASIQLKKGVYVNNEYRFSVHGQLKSCTLFVQRPGTVTILVILRFHILHFISQIVSPRGCSQFFWIVVNRVLIIGTYKMIHL